jgi:hypothetical protein
MLGEGKGALHLQVKIAEASDGTLRADSYDPDQATNREPTTVSYDGTTVKLMPMNGYGLFEGHLVNGGRELEGYWIQYDQHTPTTYTQAAYSVDLAQGAK